jgi:hypothetical protein
MTIDRAQLIKAWLWFLDSVAPLEARLRVRLQRRLWISAIARASIPRSGLGQSSTITRAIREKIRQIFRPEGWWLALTASFILIVPLQVLIFIGKLKLQWAERIFADSSTSSSWLSGIVQSSWQVLAAVLSLAFVIAVFLFEFGRERDYEARIFPLFIEHTRLTFVITFGLLSVISMGVNSILIGNELVSRAAISGLTAFNQLLFAINILFLLFLYVSTFQFINPKYFRSLALKHMREIALRSIESEAIYRAKFATISREAANLGFVAELFRIRPQAGFVLVEMDVRDEEIIYEVDDVHLGLLETAAKRCGTFQAPGQAAMIRVMAYPRVRLSGDWPEVALIPVVASRPQVTELIRGAIKLKPVGGNRGG